jgi:hypothetical protein
MAIFDAKTKFSSIFVDHSLPFLASMLYRRYSSYFTIPRKLRSLFFSSYYKYTLLGLDIYLPFLYTILPFFLIEFSYYNMLIHYFNLLNLIYKHF